MLLSIIIPSYNHAQFVLTTIRAAMAVGISDKEIIVIDDGSYDDSVGLIHDYITSAGENGSIRLIARENRGLVKTINQGLSLSRGQYFYLVASDDIPIPTGIAELVSLLEANPTLQFALGNALFMESEQQQQFLVTYGEAHKRFFSLPADLFRKELFLTYPQPILLQSAVFRTSTLKSMDGWREDLILDDMSMFTRIFSRVPVVGKDFEFRPEIMACYYRRHPNNVSRNQLRQFKTIEQLLLKLCPPDLLDAALLRNILAHGVTKKSRLGMQFVRSTISSIGFMRFMQAAISQFGEIRSERAKRCEANKLETRVLHESADQLISRT